MTLAYTVGAMNPDFSAFIAHGGKLIQYHGWGDPAIPPMASIQYYDRVRSFMAKAPDSRADVVQKGSL